MIYLKKNINYLKKIEINLKKFFELVMNVEKKIKINKSKQNFFILPFLNSFLIAQEVFTGQQKKNIIFKYKVNLGK